MKQLTIFIFLMVFMTAPGMIPAFSETTETHTGQLTLTIEGFENTNGTAKIALVNSKENYSGGEPFKGYNLGITGNRVVKTLVLPYGEYAVKVFHDENGSGELEKGVFGIPIEAYGFSNDARGTLGPPEYEKAAFKLDSPKKELVIHIK
ncbi:MAG: DUF2141 domain-containing protein [Desulfobacteraceae bacterium]|nr:DUF2141 domain-containing protein [Desulfobacteraceae bacterium]